MNTIKLAPLPGQTPSIGFGPVFFSSPNAPAVAQGDPWTLFLENQTANVGEIGHAMPWDTGLTYDGGTDQFGNLFIQGECQTPGSHQITDGAGIILSTGVVAGPSGQIGQPGQMQILGYEHCAYGPAAAPAPSPTLGIDYLVSLVMASQFTGKPVADWRTQGVQGITFVAAPPYAPPSTVTLYYGEALNDTGTAAIAAALGGTPVKVAPDPEYTMYATQIPLVNGAQATINGVSMQAVAADVARAFDQILNGAAAVKASILACFKPVGS